MKGFTLLFASLIVSLILSIALAIANISLSQYVLSSAGRESQFAFYNADTGIECALYQENKVSPFPSQYAEIPPNISCAGMNLNGVITSGSNAALTVTRYDSCLASDAPIGVQIMISKDRDPNATTGLRNVLIEARGYNTCDSTNPRRVERGLYVNFRQ